MAQNGTSSCYVANNTVQQCMPGTYEEGARQLCKLNACTLIRAASPPTSSRRPVAYLCVNVIPPVNDCSVRYSAVQHQSMQRTFKRALSVI